jgi:hypothetical protein
MALAFAILWAIVVSSADADVICRKKSGAMFVRAACKKKERPVELTAFGSVGPPGPAGADGQLRVYGDGSAGSLTLAADKDWTADDSIVDNPQFVDLTVAAGVTLTVPSGITIRCTGTFTNDGTIVVATRIGSGDRFRSPDAGIGRRAAGSGQAVPNSFIGVEGDAGNGLSLAEAATLLSVGPRIAGGGGAGANNQAGGDGGGSLLVLANTAIVNRGTIQANGEGPLNAGGGGGGGGIVILASRGSVMNSGPIEARGAAGTNGVGVFGIGAGGGGGGGVVRLISPSIGGSGLLDVAGGAAGTGDGQPNSGDHSGGGGGGASGGDGGSGGSFSNLTGPYDGNPGQAGHALQTAADPTALF